MHLLRHWWTHPVEYGWSADYHMSAGALRFTRVAVGVWCWMFAAVAVFALATPTGPMPGLPRNVVVGLTISAVVVGIAWILGSWPGRRLSVLFVVYADLALVTLFASMADPLVTFPGIALLAVVGSYIATFHDARVFVGHQVFSFVATALLYVRAITTPKADTALAFMDLMIVVLIQFSVPVLTQGMLLLLRQEATSALFDPLTGLRNRRGLHADLVRLFTDVRFDGGTSFVLLVVDIDNFKAVNDQFGHLHGDNVLTAAAATIRSIFGPPTVTCRSGGEEFTVLFSGTVSAAVDRANRLRAAVITDAGVTISIGIAAHRCLGSCGHDASIMPVYTDLAGRADAAMYDAKRSGGDTVVLVGDSPYPADRW